MDKNYFQDHMPGNVCFGCGDKNSHGLQIKSFWDKDEAVCHWTPKERYHGWKNVLNGGIMATLIDCHCMGTAMAYACKIEGRPIGSYPEYRYATGTLNVRYLKPSSSKHLVELRARVIEVKNRKTTLYCEVFSQGEKTAESVVVAIRVFDERRNKKGDNQFK